MEYVHIDFRSIRFVLLLDELRLMFDVKLVQKYKKGGFATVSAEPLCYAPRMTKSRGPFSIGLG